MAKLETVKPGDLIKADLINALITEVVALKEEVAALKGNQSNSPLFISHITPPEPVTVGTVIQIHGSNFSFPAYKNTVKIGDRVMTLKLDNAYVPPGTQLELELQGLTVDAKGTRLPVIVTNAEGHVATSSLLVMPFVDVPKGTLIVTYTKVIPPLGETTIAAGKSYIFEYLVNAAVTMEASYRAMVSLGDSGWTAEIIDNAGAPLSNPYAFSLGANPQGTNPSGMRTMRVKVTVPPNAGTATLALSVTSTTPKNEIKPGVQQPLTLKVGAPVPVPQGNILVSLRSLTGDGAKFVFETGRIAVTRTKLTKISFNVSFKEEGKYTFKFKLSKPTGWDPVDLTSSRSEFSIDKVPDGQMVTTDVYTTCTAGAAAATTDLVLAIQKNGVPLIEVAQPVDVLN